MSEFVGWDSKKIENAIGLSCMTKIQAVADLVADEARRRCPVVSGALKDTIRTAAKKGEKDIWVIAGNKEVYYARWVEFGKGGKVGSRFMAKALRSSKARAKQIVES